MQRFFFLGIPLSLAEVFKMLLQKQDLFILYTLFPPWTKSLPKHPDREALVWR